jgi:hypothetical protein
VWIGLAYKLPIAAGPWVFNSARCFCHAWHLVAAACFEQQHANVDFRPGGAQLLIPMNLTHRR